MSKEIFSYVKLKDVADDITDSVTDNGIYNSFIKYHLIEPK